MTEDTEKSCNLILSDLKKTFTDPKIRIKKENDTTIIIGIGGMIRLKLMHRNGNWYMIYNGLVLPYTGDLLEKLFLTKASRHLRDQVVNYLKSQFDIYPVHLHIA
jgi:hypothetical protein